MLALMAQVLLVAENPQWLHIVNYEEDDIYRIQSTAFEEIDSITFVRSMAGGDSLSYDIMRVAMANGRLNELYMAEGLEYVFGTNVPDIFITTNPEVGEISSKTEYLSGSFVMKGYGSCDDVDTTAVNIRGRGNTSWLEPKKPYRLKFDKKISLCGLKKAKNYVLIANYIDNTLMKNAVAFEMARLLGMPYTNHSIPVNVHLNGEYKGAYMLSEKVGINSGSVDIDEQTGVMWELDKSYDEDYKFKSTYFRNPVMLSDPDPEDLELPDSVSVDDWFAVRMADYNRMEREIYTGRYRNVLDSVQVLDYLLVHLVCGNRELNHPKSVKLYQEHPDSLYVFGPVWDFDWGFDYVNAPDMPLLQQGYSDLTGANLFYRIIRADGFMEAFRRRWEYFRNEIYPQLQDFIYGYRELTRISAYQNGARWSASGPEHTANSSEKFDLAVANLLDWLDERVEAIGSDPVYLLYTVAKTDNFVSGQTEDSENFL